MDGERRFTQRAAPAIREDAVSLVRIKEELASMQISRRSLLAASGIALMSAARGSPLAVSEADARAAHLHLQRLAWAGVRLELGGVTLFIDAIAPDPGSGQPGPQLLTRGKRTYALVTHHHDDHCDPKALAPLLGERGYLVCYEETARYFDTRLVRTRLSRMYEPIILSPAGGEFAAFAVPAVDGLGSPQVSWVVDCGGKRLIHCGDTLWHGHWWDIARAYGPFEVALLPINGFRNPQGRFTDEGLPMGMNAESAAAAAHILKARVAIPIHYGQSGDPSYTEDPNPLGRFTAAARAKGVSVNALKPGDELVVS
jgi:L-ascorbate metabolism protein UlaG (beta-lactamase superfamily)